MSTPTLNEHMDDDRDYGPDLSPEPGSDDVQEVQLGEAAAGASKTSSSL